MLNNFNQYSSILIGARANFAESANSVTFEGIPKIHRGRINGIGSDIYVHTAKKEKKKSLTERVVNEIETFLPKETINASNFRQKLDLLDIELDDITIEQLKYYQNLGLDLGEVYKILRIIKNARLKNQTNEDFNNICASIITMQIGLSNNESATDAILSNLREKVSFLKQTNLPPEQYANILTSPSVIDAEASKEILKLMTPKLRKYAEENNLLANTLCTKEDFSLQAEKILTLNLIPEKHLNEGIEDSVKKILSRNFATTKELKASVKYLNSIKNKDLTPEYIKFILENSITYSTTTFALPQLWGTEKIAQTKDELKAQLSTYRDKEGKIILSDADIESILTSENSIPDLSKIINAYKKSNIDIQGTAMQAVLTREGMTYDVLKPTLDVIDLIENDENYAFLTDSMTAESAQEFYSKLIVQNLSYEDAIKNLELLKMLKEYNNGAIWQTFENEQQYAPTIFASIITDANLKPDELKALLDNGLLDVNMRSYSIKTLLDAKIPEGTDIQDKARKIKNSNCIPNTLSLETLKNIIELDSDFEPRNLAYFENLGADFHKQSLVDKIRLVTSEKCFDENTTAFLNEASYISPKGVPLELKTLLLKHDTDYKKSAELLRTIRENNLYGILPYNLIIKGLQENGEAQYEKYIQTAMILKQYPELTAELNLKSNLLTKFLDTNTPIEQIKRNIEKANAFIKDNKDIWQILTPAQKQKLLSNAISNQDDSKNVIDDEKCATVRELMQRGMLANDTEVDFMASILSEENVSPTNLMANLEYYTKVAELKEQSNIGSTTAIDAKPAEVYEWLSLDRETLTTYLQIISDNKKTDNVSYQIDKNGNLTIITGVAPYSVKTYNKDGEKIKEAKISTGFDSKNNFIRITKTKDKGYSSELVEYYNYADKIFYPASEKITHRSLNPMECYVETRSLSDVDGVLNVERKYGNGLVQTLSSAKRTRKGVKINKNLTSLDGTKTEYSFTKSTDGKRKQTYKIKDNKGNILLDDVKTFEYKNKNTVLSTHNGKKYLAEYTDTKISIYDYQTNKTTVINLDELISEDKEMLIAMLRELNGEELILVAKNIKTLTLDRRLDSAINMLTGEMFIGPHNFIFEHELGHSKDTLSISNPDKMHLKITDPEISAKDVTYKISDDPELIRIYKEEKEIFEANFGEIQQHHISYLLTSDPKKPHLNGLIETTAETNALLNNESAQRTLSFRAQYLQQYFPRTIAYIANRLNEEIIN